MKSVILTIWSLFILLMPALAQDYYKVRKQSRISTGLDETSAIPYEEGVVYTTPVSYTHLTLPTSAVACGARGSPDH